MISSKINEDSLLEAIIFNEVVQRMKLNGEDGTGWKYGYWFIKRVARNLNFWLYLLGKDLAKEEL